MSKLEVDAIEPQSGTTLTIGASGDTVNISGDTVNIEEAQIDNLNINNNQISSTDTDGNIDLEPNGDGTVRVLANHFSVLDTTILNYYPLERTVPSSNQVTLTIETTDTTSKYGNGVIEVFLCGNGDSSNGMFSYLSYFPISVRNGTNSITVHSAIPQVNGGFTPSVSTSGTTITITFTCNGNIIEAAGYVLSRGPMAYATSATLS